MPSLSHHDVLRETPYHRDPSCVLCRDCFCIRRREMDDRSIWCCGHKRLGHRTADLTSRLDGSKKVAPCDDRNPIAGDRRLGCLRFLTDDRLSDTLALRGAPSVV
jgi:hypothetical protein